MSFMCRLAFLSTFKLNLVLAHISPHYTDEEGRQAGDHIMYVYGLGVAPERADQSACIALGSGGTTAPVCCRCVWIRGVVVVVVVAGNEECLCDGTAKTPLPCKPSVHVLYMRRQSGRLCSL